ncbi:PIG-X-domain-containing protein [Nadsonia fulvescens var. elongata DSM 6958]|uniref:Protein PBN1 n=1 Tax=Nadsonia fulvescens var. elongata DSM 6958 TaxID=857566 RepID=A0A1E3PDM2_9ASCO|nr:PIG-X-domain-containing protein [Nadsonia fulvescens var. elongata DSM 6958]
MTQSNQFIRRRHTFIVDLENDDLIDGKDSFEFTDDNQLIIRDFSTPRQDRVTIPLNAFAPENPFYKALNSVDKFQFTWAKDEKYQKVPPFEEVIEPGVHIDIVEKTESVTDWDSLQQGFESLGINLNSTTMIEGPGTRSYSAPLPSIETLVNKLIQFLCHGEAEDSQCFTDRNDLKYADSLTFNFGRDPLKSNQQKTDLVFEIYWSGSARQKMAEELGIKEQVLTKGIDGASTSQKVEIGLLNTHPSMKIEDELVLTGIIRELGSPHAEKILLNIAPRHLILRDQSYDVKFHKPLGLHPRQQITLYNARPPLNPEHAECSIFAKYTIPKSLFLDKYQLADLDRSTSAKDATGKLVALWGESDLEAPVWNVEGWGSEALVQIFDPKEPNNPNPLSFTPNTKSKFEFVFPLHSRYEVPLMNITVHDEQIAWPLLFWACEKKNYNPADELTDMKFHQESAKKIMSSPFYRSSIGGFNELFGQDVSFHHLEPAQNRLQSSFHIPVVLFSCYNVVGLFTILSILGGFLWIIRKIMAKPVLKKEKVAASPKQD